MTTSNDVILAKRLAQLTKLTQDVQKFGSIEQYLTPEQIAKADIIAAETCANIIFIDEDSLERRQQREELMGNYYGI